MEAIEGSAVEKIVLGVRLNKVALTPMNEPKPDGAGNRTAVPRDPEFFPNFVKSPDLVVPHAVVFRQNDLNIIATNLEFAAEPEYDVGETSNLRYRSQFRRDLPERWAGDGQSDGRR